MAAEVGLSLEDLTLENVKQCIPAVGLIFDSMRIVDPVAKKVLTWDNQVLRESDETCYDVWCRGKMCDNCISARANSERKCIFKLEPGTKCIMMVTALPVNYEQQPVVVELLKDVTDSLIFGPKNSTSVEQAYKAISELSTMAITDHLTSLYNRRFVDDRLEADITRSNQENQPFSVLFIDIDDFKGVNDTYGHEFGDTVLKTAAQVIHQSIRTSHHDWVARYGGDEFLVCLNDTDAAGARIVADRIHDNIKKVNVPIRDQVIQLSLSIGIHTMKLQPLAAAEIVKIADQRMYEAKFSGKNRISQSVDNQLLVASPGN